MKQLYIVTVTVVVCSVGKTANHAIVVAMLCSLGQNHGPHSFMVQLRDLVTHEPLPGWIENCCLLCHSNEIWCLCGASLLSWLPAPVQLGNSFPEGIFHAREFGNGCSHSRESWSPGNEAYSHIVLTGHAIQARHLLPAAGAA